MAESKPKAWAIAEAQEGVSATGAAAGGGGVVLPHAAAETGADSRTPSRAKSGSCPPAAAPPSSARSLPGAGAGAVTPPATSSQLSSLERASAKNNSYIGYLCYLREHRTRLRAAAPGCTSRQVEKAAAEEWKSMTQEERAPVVHRAREILVGKLAAAREGSANLDPRVVLESEETKILVKGEGWAAQGRAVDTRRRRRACECCGGLDKRDAMRCKTCAARRHLMCFFPPLVEADAQPWQCEACTDAALGGKLLRCVPVGGEEIEVEISQPESTGGAGRWTKAVVRRQLAEGRFSAVIGGDEDFVEELSMESEGEQWRRAQATMAELERQRVETQTGRGETMERRRREAEVARMDAQARSGLLLEQVEQLYREGYVIAEGAITEEQARAKNKRGSRPKIKTVPSYKCSSHISPLPCPQ